MISLYPRKDPARVIRNAVLDDVSPAPKGEVIEYWVGVTDMEPKGARKEAFEEARRLMELGRVVLFQERDDLNEVYRYRMKVV